MQRCRWDPKSLRALRGRKSQLRCILNTLDTSAESRQCRILLLASPTGSGKSRLLIESMVQAERRGFAVVDGLAERFQSLTPPATRAAHLESRISQLIRHQPVLVAIDDLQALDAANIRALSGLVSKFSGVPLVWEFALSSGGVETPGAQFFTALSQDERVQHLEPLGLLSKSAVTEVVHDLLGAEPSHDLVVLCQCFDSNPKTVVELVLSLEQDGAIDINDGIAQLRTDESAARPLLTRPEGQTTAVPAQLLSRVLDRLAGLSEPSRRCLQVAAVLGRMFSPQDLLEMLGCSPAELLVPMSDAVASGLITSEAEEFAFSHDLIWRAVLATVPIPLVSLLHREAATMLVQRKGRHTKESALHLLQSPRPDNVEGVGTIARTAERLLIGAPATAAALALRGMEITPRGSREHFAMAGTAMIGFLRSGCLEQSAQIAEEFIGQATEDTGLMADRVKASMAIVMALQGETNRALALTSASDGAARNGVSRSTDMVRLAISSFSHVETAGAVAESILTGASRRPADMTMAALSVRATGAWRRGNIHDALCAIEEAAGLWRRWSGYAFTSYPLWQQAWMLLRLQELEAAQTVMESITCVIESGNSDVLAAVPVSLRGWYRFAKGDLAGAELDASEALERCRGYHAVLPFPFLHALRALTALRRGELANASERARLLDESLPRDPLNPLWGVRCLVLAQVKAACDDTKLALEALLDADDGLQLTLADPISAVWCVRLACNAGDRSFAGRLVETTEMISAQNPNISLFANIAAHGRGLLDRDPEAVKMAAAQYSDPWAQASAREDAGVLLSTVDRVGAVSELSTAMTGFAILDANWDVARLRHRLRDLGVRRRHWIHRTRPTSGWASLTDMEEKVARLAARGLTNRQAARELFISPHTVGFHLRQIYRKLEIRSRVDLARIAQLPENMRDT